MTAETRSSFKRFWLGALVLVFLTAGCAGLTPQKGKKPGTRRKPASTQKKTSGPSKTTTPAAKPQPAVDAQAQQLQYDLGMKHYAEENYAEAKKAWEQAVRLGPNTPLADKARENIKKTDQIINTLNELNKK